LSSLLEQALNLGVKTLLKGKVTSSKQNPTVIVWLWPATEGPRGRPALLGHGGE